MGLFSKYSKWAPLALLAGSLFIAIYVFASNAQDSKVLRDVATTKQVSEASNLTADAIPGEALSD